MGSWMTERRTGHPNRRTVAVVITVHQDQKPSYAHLSGIVRKDRHGPKLMSPVGPATTRWGGHPP
jgi:hypothetical protein